jgi:hypothetical protein
LVTTSVGSNFIEQFIKTRDFSFVAFSKISALLDELQLFEASAYAKEYWKSKKKAGLAYTFKNLIDLHYR